MQTSMTKRFMIGFLLAVILSSCSKLSNATSEQLERHFLTVIPVTDMNKSLQLAIDSEWPTNGSSKEIALTIHNQSPYSLSFDTNSFMSLWGNQDNAHWVDIRNAYTYSGDLELSPNGTILLDTQYVTVEPVLDESSFDMTEDIRLRIVIVGKIMEGENRSGEEVGAYVDLVLQP